MMAAAATATLSLVAGCTQTPTSGSGQPSGPDAAAGTTSCSYQTTGGASRQVTAPATTGVPATGTVDYVVKLNSGEVPITLNRASAPCAVNSFISLAEQGFYDDTPCHRLGAVTGFSMLQCGDPTGTGAGGPGYQYSEELTGTETYPSGTLAMARTSAPGSQGSQFFLVFDDTTLSPDYTVFGTIDADGVAVLRKLAEAGTDNSEGIGVGHPAQSVTITAVTPR